MSRMHLRDVTSGRHPIRFEPPSTVPDSLIFELARLSRAPYVRDLSVRDQFVDQEFTDADMVIGPECNDKTCDSVWTRNVLALEPTTGPGLPGYWVSERPVPTIADRVIVYLHALSMSEPEASDLYFPGVQVKAQRELNELLLDYPVLMHPRVRARVRTPDGKTTGTCSVAHAICISRAGHLPRISDWPVGAAPLDRLASFANHTVTRMGLTTPSIFHRGQIQALKSRSPVNAAALYPREASSVVGLLASLGDLGHLAQPDSKLGLYLDSWSAIDVGTGAKSLPSALADAFIVASDSNARTEDSVDFTALLKSIVTVCHPEHRADFLNVLASRVGVVVFGSPRMGPPADEEMTTEAVIGAFSCALTRLVESGTFADGASAAGWIRQQLLNYEYPTLGVEPVLGFIRALRPYDLTIAESDFTIFFDDKGSPAPLSKRAPGWVSAIAINAVERAMTQVIDASASASPKAPRRMTRVGI